MTDQDTDEVLRLLKKIDYRLMTVEYKIGQYAAISALKDYGKVFSDAFSNGSLLIIDSYIIYLGYNYLTSTKATLPPIAVIGAIGIAFVILNSVFATSKNIYSSYRAYIRYTKALKSFSERMDGPVNRMRQLFSKYPDNSLNKEDLTLIFEEMTDEMNKFNDLLTNPESGKVTPPSNIDRQEVRKADENP